MTKTNAKIRHDFIVLMIGAFVAQPTLYAATTACEGAPFVLEGKLLEALQKQTSAADIAFQAEVTAAEATASEQTITFRVLKSWKGSFQAGESLSLTLPVTDVCAGLGCVFPFRVGEIALLLSPALHNEDLTGCWVYEAHTIQPTLSIPTSIILKSHRNP